MNYSRLDRRKKNNSKMKWVITVVVVLLLVLGATTYFIVNENKTAEESTPNEQPPVQNKVEAPAEPVEQPKTEEPIEKTESPEVDESGYAVVQGSVTKPTYIDGILIANKKYPLPESYNPGEDQETLAAYKKMELGAKKAGHTITAFSGFRSYEYQQELYDKYVARDGQQNADRYSARPGHSEHQTGLAFDIGEVGREDLWLTEEFGETPAGQWLVQNAHRYGFILRYPKGKEDITGFMYESWHFRYLGKEVATKVKQSGLTLEEYLQID